MFLAYKHICFLIDHPFDLALFLGLQNILREEDEEFTTIALLTDHPYFEKCVSCQDLLNKFDKVVHIRKPQFSKNLFAHYPRSISFIRAIKEINKVKNLVYITANRSELTTQLIIRYGSSDVIRILQKPNADFQSKTFRGYYMHDIKARVIRNLYEVLLLLPFSYSYRNIDTNLIRYIDYKNENKGNDLYLANIDKIPCDNEINYPYCFNNKKVNLKNIKKVYFLGSRFLSYDFIKDDNPAEIINNVLRRIEGVYGDNIEYIYKPHPLETNDSSVLSLNKFKVVIDINSAEVDYIKFHNDILAVYSIGSTSSKTAFNFGIDSYVVYRMFDLKKKAVQSYNKLFSGLPSDFFIETISEIGHPQNTSKLDVDITNLIVKITI